MRNSTFRRSLLWRQGAVSDQDGAITSMGRLHVSTRAVPVDSDGGQLHRKINIHDDVAMLLPQYVGGTHDRTALVSIAEQAVGDGRLNIEYKRRPIAESGDMKGILDRRVGGRLQKLAECSLNPGVLAYSNRGVPSWPIPS